MVDIARPVPSRTDAWRVAGALLLALVAAGVLLRAVDPARLPGLQNFLLIFSSLLVEALPFIMLGAIVSAIIEVFVPVRVFERLAGLPRPLQLPASCLAGLAFPVCECGSVPVARRLAAKGLAPSAAITFMLAAPILNPVVIASTFVAYKGRDVMVTMVAGRVVLGFLCAMTVGWVMSSEKREHLLRPVPGDEHSHGDEGRARAFFGHLSGDFFFMGRYLVIGAAVAAALQTFVPQSITGSLADTPVVALIAMMGLAFVLSLCSESDAFVAASFVQFGAGPQLAFLVFGPMVDTKLGFLYSATFRKGFLLTTALIVGSVTLAGTLWIEVIAG